MPDAVDVDRAFDPHAVAEVAHQALLHEGCGDAEGEHGKKGVANGEADDAAGCGVEAELRAIETADASGSQHPRFKQSDDATAILLRLT